METKSFRYWIRCAATRISQFEQLRRRQSSESEKSSQKRLKMGSRAHQALAVQKIMRMIKINAMA